MGEIAERVKSIIKESREKIDKGENVMKIISEAGSSFFDLARKTGSKELTVISFLWVSIYGPLRVIIEKEMKKNFPKILEKSIEGRNHELARSFLSFLSKKNLKDIRYYHLINYTRGEINFEDIRSEFQIKNLELPMEEKGFIILTIARGLEEAWKRTCAELNKIIKEYVDKLDGSLRSVEGDEEILNKLRKITEDLLYAVYLKSLR